MNPFRYKITLFCGATRRTRTKEKIAFILAEYGFANPVKHERLEPLIETRNRLVHFGRFPTKPTIKENVSLRENVILFIRLTECIIAKILGLKPSNIFETAEKLEKLLGQ